MTKKFDPKKLTKKMIWVPVAGNRGIRRRYVWNQVKERYEDPPSGALYEARRTAHRGGERVSRTFPSLQESQSWKEHRLFEAIEQEAQVQNGYRLSDLISEFRSKRFPLLSEGSVIIYERLFKSLKPIEHLVVDEIKPSDVDDWLSVLTSPEQMSQRRSTRISFDKELGALAVLLRWHIEEHDDAKLIFPIKRKHYRRGQVKKRLTRKVVLTDDESKKWLAILKATNPLFHAIAFVQISQALRISEVCAMKWSNLDMTAGRYEICEHVLWPRVQGKQAKLAPGTKTTLQSYWIPLWEDVQMVLAEMKKSAKDDLIFSLNGNILTYRQIQYAYNRAFELAGLPHRSTHVCRHTGSTQFLDQTQDLLALQQMGGWKDQTMPQHYAKVRAQRAEQAMRATERRLKIVSPEEKIG